MKGQEYANQIKLDNTPTGYIALKEKAVSKTREREERGYRQIRKADDYTQVITHTHELNTIINTTVKHNR